MELWGGHSDWAFARCSLTTFNYSLCLEVFLSFWDKNLSKVFVSSSPLQWCLTTCLEISWKHKTIFGAMEQTLQSKTRRVRACQWDNIFIAASGQACCQAPTQLLTPHSLQVLTHFSVELEIVPIIGLHPPPNHHITFLIQNTRTPRKLATSDWGS